MSPSIVNRVALGDMLRRSARKHGRRTAMIDGDRRLSYAEFDAAANRFAHYLYARGLQSGDRVVTYCGNSAELLVVFFGLMKAGMVWVPINAMLGKDDATYIVEHSDARLAVADAAHAGNLPAAIEVLPADAVTEAISDLPDVELGAEIGDRDLALIIYTSGTTARPKGVMHSHLSVYFGTLSNIAEWHFARRDVALCMMPLAHCAQHANALALLCAGATVVIQNGFDPQTVLQAIEREKVTTMLALPMMYAGLWQHPARPGTDLSSLRFCLYGMAPMPKPLLTALVGGFCPNFALGSGQTEAWPITVMFDASGHPEKDGNYWGESAPVNDTAIMDDEGELLPPGSIGEIVHRGPNVMSGYYRNAEATAEACKFGWHHTGDLGMFDADGQLKFFDRKKDMIKTGGENVATLKVDEALLRHPAIANAAVVGLPHPHWTEAVTAFVLLKPGVTATEQEIRAHCAETLSHFEVPKRVVILPALPMTPTGKIQKSTLRVEHSDLYASDSNVWPQAADCQP